MAQAYLEQDHDTCWADNDDMKERTKAYAQRAEAVAKKMNISANHPWKQGARHSPWRLRLLDLERGHHNLACENELEKIRDLLLDWESTRREGAVGERNRYVILLEDLSPRIAELLGVLLEIPPEFFLSQVYGYNELSVVDKQLFKRGSSKYWKAPVPEMRSLPRATEFGERGSYLLSCGSFDRTVGSLDHTSSREFVFTSYVSYWASSYGDGSWIAVIMMDPHPTRLLFSPASNPNDQKLIHLKNLKSPHYRRYREIMLDSAENEFAQAHERSMFDTVANAYDNAPLEFFGDPFSTTYIVRNCIRAVWEQQVWWDDSQIYETVYRNVWNHKTSQSPYSHSPEHLEDIMAIDNQARHGYQQLMAIQEILRTRRHNIRAIIHHFRPRDTYFLAEKTSRFEDYMKDEIESWKFLDEKLQYAEEFLNNHMKMYSARSAMEETYEAKMQSRESMKQTKEANRQTAAANRMARSSGQLTKIATIIVPCTFVASIFSMGGDFAAGESLFYVYWIISVPITVGLLSWILHEDIADVVEKSKRWIGSRRTLASRRTKLSEDSKV